MGFRKEPGFVPLFVHKLAYYLTMLYPAIVFILNQATTPLGIRRLGYWVKANTPFNMTEIIVAGLDVGKDSCSFVAWPLTRPLGNPKDFFDYEAEIEVLFPDQESIEKILAHKPSDEKLVVFLEPTGPYSGVWIDNLRQQGVEVHQVPHNLVNSSRLALCGWDDKDDDHDAIVLLVLGLRYLADSSNFNLVREKDPVISRLNELYLNSESCNKVLNGLLNRAKQKLHRECPKLADTDSKPTKAGGPPIFWSWIVGEKSLPLGKISEYGQALHNSIGSAKRDGFSKQLIAYARSICEWMVRRHRIEEEMRSLLKNKRFEKYLRIFRKFGAALDTQAIWLIQLFPFERFLGADNQPIIKIKKRGTRSGKPTKAHVSCRKFHSAMGMAPNQRSSGKKKGEIISGSGACRIALWRLVFGQIETNGPGSLRNRIGRELRTFLNAEKFHRDELMDALVAVLTDIKTGPDTLNQIKSVLLNCKHPTAKTIAENLEKTIKAHKGIQIEKEIRCALVRLARSRCAARLVKRLFKEMIQVFSYGQPIDDGDDTPKDDNGVPYYLSGKALAARLGKNRSWIYKSRKKYGDEDFPNFLATLDPSGYKWKLHSRKFWYAIAPGEVDDSGARALSVY